MYAPSFGEMLELVRIYGITIYALNKMNPEISEKIIEMELRILSADDDDVRSPKLDIKHNDLLRSLLKYMLNLDQYDYLLRPIAKLAAKFTKTDRIIEKLPNFIQHLSEKYGEELFSSSIILKALILKEEVPKALVAGIFVRLVSDNRDQLHLGSLPSKSKFI